MAKGKDERPHRWIKVLADEWRSVREATQQEFFAQGEGMGAVRMRAAWGPVDARRRRGLLSET